MNENWISGGYCNPAEWEIVKKEEKQKWQAKGYKDLKCKLVRSDTKGLRMYVVIGNKENA